KDLLILIDSLKMVRDTISEDVEIEYDDKNLSPQQMINLMIVDVNKEIESKQYYEKVQEAISKNESTIPKNEWPVHEAHCCLYSGCKYGDQDCPVVLELIEQKYICEDCDCKFKKD
ncbi:MAG: hypothetical protein ABIP51_01740, partial [Bacteroidia bacterium]